MLEQQKPETYPKEVLPRSTYKKRLNVDKLLNKYKNLLAVRVVKGKPEDFYKVTANGEKEISQKVFSSSMANLSMNLAGGRYNVTSFSHLRFLPKAEVAMTWEGGKVNKNFCSDNSCFSSFDSCFGLCFHVSDIHGRSFPFHKHFDTKAERDKYAEEVKSVTKDVNVKGDIDLVGAFVSKRDTVLVHPRIIVHHSPTNANYWHMTLDTYRPNNAHYVHPNENLNSSDKKMFKALKQDLVQHCEINEEPDYNIEDKDYYAPFFYYLKQIFPFIFK